MPSLPPPSGGQDNAIALNRSIPSEEYSMLGNGDPSDSAKLIQALADATSAGLPLSLQKGTFNLINPAKVSRLIGVKGQTKILINTASMVGSFNNQAMFNNANFNRGAYQGDSADVVYVENIIFEYYPNQTISGFNFAGCQKIVFLNCTFIAHQVVNQNTGIPNVVMQFVEIYGCCKNILIQKCTFRMLTSARDQTSDWEGYPNGGSCISVFNACDHTVATDGVSIVENVEICYCLFEHMSTDEAVCFIGRIGTVRNVRLHHNWIYGLEIDTAHPALHGSLITAYPGSYHTFPDAAIYDVSIHDNYINDKSWLNSICRISEPNDVYVSEVWAGNICERINFSRNTIISQRRNDAYSPHNIWAASSSSSKGGDPDINSTILYAYRGSLNTQFDNAYVMDNNKIIVKDLSPVAYGAQYLTRSYDDVLRGNMLIGMNGIFREGGEVFAATTAFQNCPLMKGGKARVSGTSTSKQIVKIGNPFAGEYIIDGVDFYSDGYFVQYTNNGYWDSDIKLTVRNCHGYANASDGPSIRWSASVAGGGYGTVEAYDNIITGSNTALTDGSAAIKAWGNTHNATLDTRFLDLKASASASLDAALSDSLTGWWSMDTADISGTSPVLCADRSWGQNSATLTNCTTGLDAHGRGIVIFNGTNSVVTTGQVISALLSATSGAVSLWVNVGANAPTTTSYWSNGAPIFSDVNGASAGYFFLVAANWNGVGGNAFAAGVYDSAEKVVSMSYTVDTWYHLVVALKTIGGTTKLYLYANGVLMGSVTTTGISFLTNAMQFGKGGSGNPHLLTASMRDMRVFSAAPTPYEIQSLYKAGALG